MNCDSDILVDLDSSDDTVLSFIFGFTSESEENEGNIMPHAPLGFDRVV